MTEHEEFGSGIYLEETGEDGDGYPWDLDTKDGDVRMVVGEDELHKDVAFRAARTLRDFVGQPIRPVTINRIEGATYDFLRDEPRIDAILSVDASASTFDEVKVDATVVAFGDEMELVFEVTE